MNEHLNVLLNEIRKQSTSNTEQGRYFEQLAQTFLRHDRVQQQSYEEVLAYSDWADQYDLPSTDIGIDLVAKLRNGSGWCAIQAKFYKPEHRISKADIDSFAAASADLGFVQRLLIDTTDGELSKNVRLQLDQSPIEWKRVTLENLANSSIHWQSVLEKATHVEQRPARSPRPHQREAIDDVIKGFATHNRGQLIMACGTGKTYTGLKIAEQTVSEGGRVLVLVPSLALINQMVSEWMQDASRKLFAFAVCSDVSVGTKTGSGSEDGIQFDIHDLQVPPTTNADQLVAKMESATDERSMTVVFATYQSLKVIEDAQKTRNLDEFDLILCDEAHRTTGQIKADKEASSFVIVHDQQRIRGARRLYMTATPRVYSEGASKKAAEGSVELCSMDDSDRYGPVFHYLGFAEAVEKNLLTNYQVVVLELSEQEISDSVKSLLARDNELNLDEATKIVGCWKALMKLGKPGEFDADPEPSKRALAFCNTIKNSRRIARLFEQVVYEYQSHNEPSKKVPNCSVDHADGTMNAKERRRLLDWLEDDSEQCRVLSNVRCLSEGVDVPALDAILFLHPRKSQIDVVQSVGRVMRTSPGKKMGYVVLPIGIPPGVDPISALDNNERYRVVWQILTALQSHDESLAAELTAMRLDPNKVSDRIKVLSQLPEAANIDSLPRKTGGGGPGPGPEPEPGNGGENSGGELPFRLNEAVKRNLLARMVNHCAPSDYWGDWAEDVAQIAERHIVRINTVISKYDSAKREFERFLAELRDDLNPSVTEREAVEMLAQHMITRPVFEALFGGDSFVKQNSISIAMQSIVDKLVDEGLEKETSDLQKFYESVARRAREVDTAEGRQNLIRQLYEKFFQKAFKKVSERLGIVFTPVEIVDYILQSVDDVLRSEFGTSISSEGIHILDPFTGTGTFPARLLESGLINPKDLERKYSNEIHSNEIVPLAYYIAGVNIEKAYHSNIQNTHTPGHTYLPFGGLCLTDTFHASSSGSKLDDLFPLNHVRLETQNNLDIRVIVGNPPYSRGASSGDENAANLKYEQVDRRIEDTFAAKSTATLKNPLYDSYIRALRWALDRIGEQGIVAFVTNSGWLRGNSADGLRACLQDECDKVYILDLRGNARTTGEVWRQEGGKIFGSGSRAAIAVTILVKNPKTAPQIGKILYHDIGDYLSRDKKLMKIRGFRSVNGVPWKAIKPNEHNDWLDQRKKDFDDFIPLGDKKNVEDWTIFENYVLGVNTSRDAWCWNFNLKQLRVNIKETFDYFNKELKRLKTSSLSLSAREIQDRVSYDTTKISWSRSFWNAIRNNRRKMSQSDEFRRGCYRPFNSQHLHFSHQSCDLISQQRQIFPNPRSQNLVICIEGIGTTSFSVLMTDRIPDLHLLSTTQCFPLYFYDSDSLLLERRDQRHSSSRHLAITDRALGDFRKRYKNKSIGKKDIFYFVYGLLHSPDYPKLYQANLYRSLARIPNLQHSVDFDEFKSAGEKLGDLHVNFESADLHPILINGRSDGMEGLSAPDFRVKKMRWGKNKDRSHIVYNDRITISDIPQEAYEYVVNGKSAIEWVMDRQRIITHKASGITNDPNDYAVETMGDPAYPLKLVQRVITVSLETVKIVKNLPPLQIRKEAK